MQVWIHTKLTGDFKWRIRYLLHTVLDELLVFVAFSNSERGV